MLIRTGDTVEVIAGNDRGQKSRVIKVNRTTGKAIVEAPPRSKLKRWDLVRIVSRCQQVDIAAMRAAAELKESQAAEQEKPAEV